MNVKKVVVGCQDPFPAVKGKGIEKLKAAGIEVIINSLDKQCIQLNKAFFTFHKLHRPYIILKWAQTTDLRLDHQKQERLLISNEEATTIIFNSKQHTVPDNWAITSNEKGVFYYQVSEDVNLVHQILNALYHFKIQSLMVEGGAYLLQSFIDDGAWDEARVITNKNLVVGEGLPAPVLTNQQLDNTEDILSDTVQYFFKTNNLYP
jgi:diaminohydroxyphosphoribosylaminopyrimidine deaminase/5-amino-6-(5-phosphoribosylamino)uracil reductase